MTKERLEQLVYEMLEWIGYDNDNMRDTLDHFNLTAEELRSVGCDGYATMMEDAEQEERKTLWVCDRCLCAIQSREGRQATFVHDVDPEDEVESKCNWCEETGFDQLNELV